MKGKIFKDYRRILDVQVYACLLKYLVFKSFKVRARGVFFSIVKPVKTETVYNGMLSYTEENHGPDGWNTIQLYLLGRKPL